MYIYIYIILYIYYTHNLIDIIKAWTCTTCVTPTTEDLDAQQYPAFLLSDRQMPNGYLEYDVLCEFPISNPHIGQKM